MSKSLWRTRFGRDHRWTPSHVSPYLENDLGRRGRNRLRRHVADCPECRALLLSMERMIGALSRLSRSTSSEAPDLAEAVRRRLRE
jgi:anti-sigma factor RsiW